MYWIYGYDLPLVHSISFFTGVGNPLREKFADPDYDQEGPHLPRNANEHRFFEKQNTATDWIMAPTNRPCIEAPSLRVHTVEIPGGHGSVDLTTALTGFPTYSNRTGSIDLMIMNDVRDWVSSYSMIQGYLNGTNKYLILYDDPGYYYEGRVSLNALKTGDHNSTITFDYDLKPFKMEITDTSELELWDCFDFEYGCSLGDLFEKFPMLPIFQVNSTYDASGDPPMPEDDEMYDLAFKRPFKVDFTALPKFIFTEKEKQWALPTEYDTARGFPEYTDSTHTVLTEFGEQELNILKKLYDTVSIPYDMLVYGSVLGHKPIYPDRYELPTSYGGSYTYHASIKNQEEKFDRLYIKRCENSAPAGYADYIPLDTDDRMMLSSYSPFNECSISVYYTSPSPVFFAETAQNSGKGFSIRFRRGLL